MGDIVLFDSVTLPGGTGYTAADFEDKNYFKLYLFQVQQLLQFTSSNASTATGGSVI